MSNSLKKSLSNERGLLDLPSVMVGVLVSALVSGALAGLFMFVFTMDMNNQRADENTASVAAFTSVLNKDAVAAENITSTGDTLTLTSDCKTITYRKSADQLFRDVDDCGTFSTRSMLLFDEVSFSANTAVRNVFKVTVTMVTPAGEIVNATVAT